MAYVEVEHSLSVLAMFKEMRRRRFICDFSLKVGNVDMPVHRAVLAASSDYFVRLFSPDIKNLPDPFLVENMEPRSLATCIDFMYGGSAFVDMETVHGVLHAALALQLHGLVKMCVNFLEKSIALGNCLRIRAIAKDYNFVSVLSVAERYADQNFDLVVQASGYQELSCFEVMEFMGRASNHVQKWQAAISWVKGHTEERLGYLEDMLKMVIADKCPFEFLYETIFGHALISKSQNLSTLVAESLFSAMAPFNLSLDNCFDLLLIARTYEDQCQTKVLHCIRDYIAANFDSVSHRDGFRALDQEDLFGILDSQNSTLHIAEMKWKAAVSWVKSDLQRRKSHILKILQSIDWSRCPVEFVQHYVYRECLVKQLEDCPSAAASLLFSIMKNSDINLTNWFSLLEIAKEHEEAKSQEAKKKIFYFAAVNFDDVSKRNSFGRLSSEDIKDLLVSGAVKAMPEEVKWEAVLKWVKRDVQSRKVDLCDILKCCHLNTWQFKFLYHNVYSNDLVLESDPCRQLVISAFLSNLKEDEVFVDNCFDLLKLAKTHNATFSGQAIGRIKCSLVKNYEEASKLPEFLSLEEADLYSVLDSKEFASCNEEMKWAPIFTWLMHEESRHKSLPDILMKLNLQNFSFRFLNTKIWSRDVVQTVPGCKEVCLSAMLSNVRYNDISIVNWFQLLGLAKKNEHQNSREIVAKIYQFMAANFAQIQQQAHFGSLGKEEILCMLNSPEIANSPPAEQLRGAIEWLKADDRMENAVEVLTSLKLEGFPFDLLFGNLQERTLVAESAECTDLFLTALQSNLKNIDLNMENWGRFLAIAKKNGPSKFGKIRHEIHRFVAQNFGTIFSQSHHKDLEIEDLHAVLRASELCVTEETKAQAILSWTEVDDDRRHHELPNLLRLVILGRVPKPYLKEIYSNQMVKKSEQCKDMLLEALIADDQQESN